MLVVISLRKETESFNKNGNKGKRYQSHFYKGNKNKQDKLF